MVRSMQGALVNGVEIFFIVLVRVSGIFIIAPFFGRRNIPNIFKMGFSLLMTIIIVNSIQFDKFNIDESLISYTAIILKEFFVGLFLGYVAFLVFSAIYLAGQLIDMQIGFGIVNVLDPMSNIQVPITSNFYILLGTLILLVMDGHHLMIKGVYESFKILPPGNINFGNALMNEVLLMFGNMFVIAVKIAAPVTCAILLTDVALGVISRAIPQLNIFIVGMPLKILIGIFVILVTISFFVVISKDLIDTIGIEMLKVMKILKGN